MKKIAFLLVGLLLLTGVSYAEIGATAYSSNSRFDEEQVFVICYNNSGAAISSNQVVIIDTTAADAASASTMGARIATTTTAGDPRVVGVTDQTIANQNYGKVCVRGPHKVYWLTTAGPAIVGASVASNTTAGSGAAAAGSTAVPFGFLMTSTVTQDNSTRGSSPDMSADREPNNLYWMYIKP